MGKQSKGRKTVEKLGTGKVTPVQVAFIVDRYLSENQFTKTLSEFRQEAASIFGGNKPKQAPRGMLSLVDILDDYITLKEQKIAVNQEKCRMDQLMQSMQEIMAAYHSGAMIPSMASASPPMEASQPEVATTSNPGPTVPQLSMVPASASIPVSAPVPPRSSVAVPSNNKRKNPSTTATASKRPCLASQPMNCYPMENVGQASLPTYAYQISSQIPATVQHCTGPVMYTVPQNNSQPVLGKQIVGKQSQVVSQPAAEASCPQTPPQAFHSSNGGSSPANAGSVYNQDHHKICNRQTEQSSVKSAATTSQRTDSAASCEGNPNSRKENKREIIKNRLDFSSSTASTQLPVSETQQAEEAPSSADPPAAAPSDVDDPLLELPDLAPIDVEFDQFMQDLFSGFQNFEQDDSDGKSGDISVRIDDNHPADSASQPLLGHASINPQETGILAEKNTNTEVQANGLKTVGSGWLSVRQNSPTKVAKHKGMHGNQENVPILKS